MFKINDEVKIIKIARWWDRWVNRMDKTLNLIGTITYIYHDGSYFVNFKDSYGFYYPEESLELVDKYVIGDNTTVGEIKEILEEIKIIEKCKEIKAVIYRDSIDFINWIYDSYICDNKDLSDYMSKHKKDRIQEIANHLEEKLSDKKVLREIADILVDKGILK